MMWGMFCLVQHFNTLKLLLPRRAREKEFSTYLEYLFKTSYRIAQILPDAFINVLDYSLILRGLFNKMVCCQIKTINCLLTVNPVFIFVDLHLVHMEKAVVSIDRVEINRLLVI